MDLQLMFEENAPKLATYYITYHKKSIPLFGSWEDMFQSIMLFAWKHNKRYESKLCKYSSFLLAMFNYCVGRKICYSRVLKRNGDVVSLDDKVGFDKKETYADILVSDYDLGAEYEIKELMDRLCPESYKHFVEDKTYSQIGKEMGYSRQNAQKIVNANIEEIRRKYYADWNAPIG